MPTEPEKRVDDAEFMEVSKDPAAARALRKALEQIAGGGAGGTLQEMAKEVLSGRIGLRDAVNVPAYAEAMVDQSQSVRNEWASMSDKERGELAAEGGRYLEAQRAEIEEERLRDLGSGRNAHAKHRQY
ncbi:hypothetical protein [Streptomyces sioyaensis]|uniref:hypothetical protein n=1 Tax=Streptomyces sioyaensis TaxID=67364 RepID=UPI0037177D28